MKTKMVVKQDTVPIITTSRKTLLIFSTFGVFGIMLAAFFIFDLQELSNKRRAGKIILKNSSFERWRKGSPVGWQVKGATVTIEDKQFIDGGLSVGIHNETNQPRGISQKVTLNPHETYTIRYSLKADADNEETVGVNISYSGKEVETTVHTLEGIHFHEGGTKWQTYYGRVTGASSIELMFFSRAKVTGYVDGVGISIEPMPDPKVYTD
jgi:hypothetical protein